jgi:hypothetical protein
MTPPTLDEFLEHGAQRLQIMGENPEHYKKSLIAKYLAWSDNDWHTGNGRVIKNWKSTLSNTLPYLKSNKIEVKEPETVFDKFRKKHGITSN